MKIRLDRTVCNGFGICLKHAPETFSEDDWGFVSLVGDGIVADEDAPGVIRALLDCPVHAITELNSVGADGAALARAVEPGSAQGS